MRSSTEATRLSGVQYVGLVARASPFMARTKPEISRRCLRASAVYRPCLRAFLFPLHVLEIIIVDERCVRLIDRDGGRPLLDRTEQLAVAAALAATAALFPNAAIT